MEVKLSQHPVHMRLHRPDREVQPLSDFAIGRTVCDQPGHLELAPGEDLPAARLEARDASGAVGCLRACIRAETRLELPGGVDVGGHSEPLEGRQCRFCFNSGRSPVAGSRQGPRQLQTDVRREQGPVAVQEEHQRRFQLLDSARVLALVDCDSRASRRCAALLAAATSPRRSSSSTSRARAGPRRMRSEPRPRV